MCQVAEIKVKWMSQSSFKFPVKFEQPELVTEVNVKREWIFFFLDPAENYKPLLSLPTRKALFGTYVFNSYACMSIVRFMLMMESEPIRT